MSSLSPKTKKERRKGIGGSEWAIALGLSKWKTPLQLYREKRGEVEVPEPDEAQQRLFLRGNMLEPLIRRHYERMTGERVTQLFPLDTPGVWHQNGVMFCHPDGATESGRYQEYKTAMTFAAAGWGEEETDQIPESYMVQVQGGLACSGLEVADVVVCIGNRELDVLAALLASGVMLTEEQEIAIMEQLTVRRYEVQADPDLQAMIEEGVLEFWRGVVDGVPPAPRTSAEASERFRQSTPNAVTATSEVEDACRKLAAVKAQLKVLDGEKDELETAVKAAIGDNEALLDVGGKTLATWKSDKAGITRVDAKALQAAHPDIYEKFSKTADPIRRFLLKVKP